MNNASRSMSAPFDSEKLIKRALNKKIVLSVLILITVASTLNILILRRESLLGDFQPIGQSKGWNLIFNDEFNGESLDTTKWVPCFHWGTDIGCGSTTTPQNWYRPDNITVSNGTLKLKAQRQSITVNGTSYPYTSAMITTGPLDITKSDAKFGFMYGYMEIRAKVPKGQGLWPAFWALPTDGTQLPEIDISEILTGSGFTTHTNNMTYHAEKDSIYSSSASWTSPIDLADDFHVYAADWEPDGIHWYVDGVERRSAFTSREHISAKQMYLLIQLEVGGTLPGGPDIRTPFPSFYEIDYVRIWQHSH